MKKFIVETRIITKQNVRYEMEAESVEAVKKMLETDNIQDIGTCVDEDAPEFYYDELNYIEEKKHD